MKYKKISISLLIQIAMGIATGPAYAEIVTYEIGVTTANKDDAGTDAKITLRLVASGPKNEKGEAGPDRASEVVLTHESRKSVNNRWVPLPSPPPKGINERGQQEIFEYNLDELGDLKQVEVTTDGTGDGPDWELEQITVKNKKNDKVWTFPNSGIISTGTNPRILYPK